MKTKNNKKPINLKPLWRFITPSVLNPFDDDQRPPTADHPSPLQLCFQFSYRSPGIPIPHRFKFSSGTQVLRPKSLY
ncbi:hypothetical protein L6452_28891 [Arctium lappa]|uniref:Uncharacterized protein n=1 Tax=Arctium lappa TaxID=4217 RepID=A0ACB9A417_ARCLA|nr:hypothetical protein L6452_28891 [Arctium lappa]